MRIHRYQHCIKRSYIYKRFVFFIVQSDDLYHALGRIVSRQGTQMSRVPDATHRQTHWSDASARQCRLATADVVAVDPNKGWPARTKRGRDGTKRMI